MTDALIHEDLGAAWRKARPRPAGRHLDSAACSRQSHRALEAAAEELLSQPEVKRMADHALSGPLPEELGRLLVRHRVVERIAHEFAASGELERLLDSALASPQSREVIDRLLANVWARLSVP